MTPCGGQLKHYKYMFITLGKSFEFTSSYKNFMLIISGRFLFSTKFSSIEMYQFTNFIRCYIISRNNSNICISPAFAQIYKFRIVQKYKILISNIYIISQKTQTCFLCLLWDK